MSANFLQNHFRVGQNHSSRGKKWRLKQAPGWAIVAVADSLPEIAKHPTLAGADLAQISVLTSGEWHSLAWWLEQGREPL